MEKKYEFTEQTMMVGGVVILRRIRAVRSFGGIQAGTLGGWIESEDNLSHEGDCWVADNACVMMNARVAQNAIVEGDAVVSENAVVIGNAAVNAAVFGEALIDGEAYLTDQVMVGGEAHIGGNAFLAGMALIHHTHEVLTICPVGEYDEAVSFYQRPLGSIMACCFGRAYPLADFEKGLDGLLNEKICAAAANMARVHFEEV